MQVAGHNSAVLRGHGALALPPSRSIRRHLVITWRPGWQDVADWHEIADHVRDIDPTIEPFVLRGDQPNSYHRRKAALRPSLIFSSSQLVRFRPMRGRVYAGHKIPKLEQLRRLSEAGVPVPRTEVLTRELKVDPADWGEFVIVKPTDIASSSKGRGIQLMRAERVRYIRPQDYPDGHPGQRGPMVVQQFVDTGPEILLMRVLTLFGEPLYMTRMRAPKPILDLRSASDEAIENMKIATQNADEKINDFVVDEEALAMARRIHAAVPEIPQKGCDIIRDVRTGALYVLEFNPGGNTWHFSSRSSAPTRARRPPEHEVNRKRQFDAFRTAARVFVERTNAEAV